MTVLILDENLIWSERLRLGVKALGHDPTVASAPGGEPVADIAIVNLGSRVFPPTEWIPKLKAASVTIIAHAGHKEKPLLQLGEDTGADIVVSNGTLTHKLDEVLASAMALRAPSLNVSVTDS